MRAKKFQVWDPYEVQELRGKTLGILGYGDIGAACARLARAFKMRVIALRRRAHMSDAEKDEGVLVGAIGEMGKELFAVCQSTELASFLIAACFSSLLNTVFLFAG